MFSSQRPLSDKGQNPAACSVDSYFCLIWPDYSKYFPRRPIDCDTLGSNGYLDGCQSSDQYLDDDTISWDDVTLTSKIATGIVVGIIIVIVGICIGISIAQLVKCRRKRRTDTGSSQPEQPQPGTNAHGRTRITDGPLPYKTDSIPPNYVDLYLDDGDLPTYTQAVTSR